jgi:hypothetical protein
MSVVSPSQSNAGDTIEASDINNPINQIAAVINGNIDATNIADNAVTTNKIANNSVTGAKLNIVSASYTAVVAATGSTTSISYTDPSGTGGPAVTVTINTSGNALVTVSALLYNSTGNDASMSFALTGTNIVAATDGHRLMKTGGEGIQASYTVLLTGLTAGSTTFTANTAPVMLLPPPTSYYVK